jgi:hypothetical protein
VLTKQDIIAGALETLQGYQHVSSRIPASAIARSVDAAWSDPPPPLVFLLFLAGSDVGGTQVAKDMLDSLETLLALLTQTTAVSGAWQSRMNRVIRWDAAPTSTVTVPIFSRHCSS